MRIVIAAICTFLLSGVAAFAEPRFGVASPGAEHKLCVTFDGPDLTPLARFVAAFFDPPFVLEGLAIERLTSECGMRGDLVGVAYRSVQVSRPVREIETVGIAVTGGPYRTRVSAAGVHLQPKRGAELTLRVCASEEGLHLTAWRDGTRIWHEYYYLGYSVDPTCSEDEWRD